MIVSVRTRDSNRWSRHLGELRGYPFTEHGISMLDRLSNRPQPDRRSARCVLSIRLARGPVVSLGDQ